MDHSFGALRHGVTSGQRISSWIGAASPIVLSCVIALPTPARAVDGCTVLLCLAAPRWRDVPQCVPPVHEVFKDMAKGKPFPSCSMAGAGNSAGNAWASALDFCPPQYTRVVDDGNGPVQQCDYVGAVTVLIDGAIFSRTWWSLGGETVTEFSAAAKAQLGIWDTRFDDDYAAWIASLPTPAPPVEPSY